MDIFAAAAAGGQPVAADIQDRIVAPFLEATAMTLREMAGVDVAPGGVYRNLLRTTLGDVTAVLGLKADVDGVLALHFPEATARSLAERLLAAATEERSPELIQDCMGEVVNVIAGQAKALLFGTPYHFTLSTPRVVAGVGREIDCPATGDGLLVAFDSDVGGFVLQVILNY